MFRRPGLPQPVRTIVAMTKHRFMGDTFVAIPMLRGAREVFPEAHITLVTGKQSAVALEQCPFMNRVISYNPHDETFNWRRLSQEITEGERRPDLCLVADRSFRTAYLALAIGGKVRAGFASEWRSFLLTHPVPYRTDAPEIECCLDILREIAPEGKDSPPYDSKPQLFLTYAEKEHGAAILAERKATGPVLIGIQAGANDGKGWVPERYGMVASELAREGACIVLLGYGPDEEKAAHRMREAMCGVPVIDLTGKTQLRETMGVLANLSLFIGNDTGINHIAAALEVPTIGLFGPTSAIKWGNVGPKNKVLTAPHSDLTQLEVAPVLDLARHLLGKRMTSEPVPLGAAR